MAATPVADPSEEETIVMEEVAQGLDLDRATTGNFIPLYVFIYLLPDAIFSSSKRLTPRQCRCRGLFSHRLSGNGLLSARSCTQR